MLSRFVIIISCAAVTFALRAFPFLLLQKRELPKRIEYVGKVLPMAIMATLVVYCLRDIQGGGASENISMIIGVAATVFIHLWKKNTVLSILIGTIVYMVLIRL